MGHATTEQVRKKDIQTPSSKNQAATISQLPSPDELPYILHIAS